MGETASIPKLWLGCGRRSKALGYMPNQAARILKGHRTKTIGLIIPSIADPFFASCAEAAQVIARTHDSLLIVTTTHNEPDAEIESVKVLMQHQTDGLIIAPAEIGQQRSAESAGSRRGAGSGARPAIAGFFDTVCGGG